jgi:signal transduction histidine kinase
LVHELNHANAQLTDFNEHLEGLVEQRTHDLQKTYQMLERLDRSKADFITVAAHELRTPLTLIRGYAEMLKEELQAEPNALMLTEGILTGESRMLDVVNSMLDVTRIESQVLRLNSSLQNLRMVIEAVRRIYASSLEERQQLLHLRGFETLPVIEADSELLVKLFSHLVSNAIKFTPNGGEISISAETVPTGSAPEQAEAVRIVVSDTGIGIRPEDQELIFQKFFVTGPVRLHSSSSTSYKGGGPGLGLAIARGIVEAHGGRIWVESAAYDEQALPGSAFYVLLPVKRAKILLDERRAPG